MNMHAMNIYLTDASRRGRRLWGGVCTHGVTTMLGVSLQARRDTTQVMLGVSLRARLDNKSGASVQQNARKNTEVRRPYV